VFKSTSILVSFLLKVSSLLMIIISTSLEISAQWLGLLIVLDPRRPQLCDWESSKTRLINISYFLYVISVHLIVFLETATNLAITFYKDKLINRIHEWWFVSINLSLARFAYLVKTALNFYRTRRRITVWQKPAFPEPVDSTYSLLF
jgi:hypothetical protein